MEEERRHRICVVLDCDASLIARVRYVFDTFFMSVGMLVEYTESPPSRDAWLFYGTAKQSSWPLERCLAIAHCPESWQLYRDNVDVTQSVAVDGVLAVLPQKRLDFNARSDISFDLVANAFYFLSSWSERLDTTGTTRQLYAASVFARLRVPQNIVDQYLELLASRLGTVRATGAGDAVPRSTWPGNAKFAIVLSHDVDFLPTSTLNVLSQGGEDACQAHIEGTCPW